MVFLQFHFILDVAVGGNMFPDWCVNQPFGQPLEKPWKMSDPVQMRPFWENREHWLPTWNIETEDNAMRIDYIRVYALNQDKNTEEVSELQLNQSPLYWLKA